MKSPCILKTEGGQIAYLFKDGSGYNLNVAGEGAYIKSKLIIFNSDKNITHEYLSNTWGVVESKEHAEFIIKLAMSNNLGFYDDKDVIECNYFTFNEDSKLFFYEYEDELNKFRCKQITIPLPPKAKEWPQVGDEVTTSMGSGFVMMMPDKYGSFVVDIKGFHHLLTIDELAKPKSKQDLLIEELQTKLCNNNAVDNYILACDIINGEIEGLSYDS